VAPPSSLLAQLVSIIDQHALQLQVDSIMEAKENALTEVELTAQSLPFRARRQYIDSTSNEINRMADYPAVLLTKALISVTDSKLIPNMAAAPKRAADEITATSFCSNNMLLQITPWVLAAVFILL
jgi:hypothetical protein